MKYALLLTWLVIPIISFSQQSNADIKKLIEITDNGILENKEISFDDELNSLIIGNLVIPVSKQTYVKRIKKKGHHYVEFSLQEGTAITSTANPDLRRAWLLLQFKSRAPAKDFIKQFKNVAER